MESAVQFPPMDKMDNRDLSRRIREAIQWCDPRADIHSSKCLRTLPVFLYPFCSGHEIVEALVVQRAGALGLPTVARYNTFQTESVITLSELCGGRILVLEPDNYLHEGMEESESCDYFDCFCTPPTDTWLVYLDDVPEVRGGVLLAWVPEPFVKPVQLGMAVNTTGCIYWIEDLADARAKEFCEVIRRSTPG